MDPQFATYVSVTFLFAITPGATTAVVVRNAIEGGWRSGLRTAVGAAGGNTCQALAAGFGLAVLLRQEPRAYAALRYAGAGYLGWLGLQSLWRAWHGLPRTSIAGQPASGADAAVRQGLLANILNPSVGTFYLAILPSFLPAHPGALRFAAYAAVHISIAFVCHCGWATAFDRLKALFVRPWFARLVEAASGGVLFWLAGRLLGRA
ncbi:MAG TPA: LysE family translocator [Vicinamibacterales bacterium]|nr:LysE family translocator [Vicinamibacterales bacterium]